MMSNSNRRIRILALVPYPPGSSPSQRFRLEQWLPFLESEGISVDLVPFADESMMRFLYKPGRHAAKVISCVRAFSRRLGALATTTAYDAVLIHRAACLIGPALIERAIALRGCPIIFDFDDAIYLPDTAEANQRFRWLKFAGKTAGLCRMSAHVVVGNSHLAEYARQYNPNVTVIPSSVDTDRFRPVRQLQHGRVVVGWTGSSTSQSHLEMFAPVLRQLIEKRNVELWVHSDREPALPGIPFVWRPWSAETEAQELAHFDIGIMPIPDDPWARGKCAMKALLYMAMGIPTVCSAVGTNREVIEHGCNGLLAESPDQWLTCLTALIDSADLRLRLGAEGRRTIEERYSKNKSAALFAQVARDTVERAHKGSLLNRADSGTTQHSEKARA